MKKILLFILTLIIFVFPIQAFATDTVELQVEKGNIYTSIMDVSYSTNNFSDFVNNYIIKETEETYSIIENSPILGTTVSVYNTKTNTLIETKKIENELSNFAGFYNGKNYYYMAFTEYNEDHDDNKEVLRIVKYDKNFNKINHVSVTNCFTKMIGKAGTLKMMEKNNTLVVHTSRLRYDGHQSQLTVIIDLSTMEIVEKYTLEPFPINMVSHSLDQFIINDNNDFVLLDLGDSTPRSVVISKYNPITKFNETTVDLLEIPGENGANCTGVKIGGLESSDENYLIAINKIDFNKVTEFTSLKLVGLDKDERDIVLLVQNKNFSGKTKQISLTNYINQNKLGSRPFIVKISNNKFVILWQEFEYKDNLTVKNNGIKYVFVDGNGNLLSEILSKKDMKLSVDCQPIIINNNIVWFTNDCNPYDMDNPLPMYFGAPHTRLLNCIEIEDVVTTEIDTNEKEETNNITNTTITVKINGKTIEFDQEPVIINNRTMVPVRAIFEELGAVVNWENETQTVVATKDDKTISLRINDYTIHINNNTVTLDSPACLVNSRTLVPVRAISEAFNCKVDWDDLTKTVFITY